MQPESMSARLVAWCSFVVIVALYVVGIVSHGIIRHIVQTAPMWAAVWLGMRRSEWAKWSAFPSYLIWLALMIEIWLFLAGWSHLISGTFSPIEIAMTIVIAVASIAGMVVSLRSRTSVSWPAGLAVFLLMACLQLLALKISFLPHVAHDPW